MLKNPVSSLSASGDVSHSNRYAKRRLHGKENCNASNHSEQCPAAALPCELWTAICDYLNDKDLCNVRSCCTHFCSLIKEDCFWIHRTKKALFLFNLDDNIRRSLMQRYVLSRKWSERAYVEESAVHFFNRHIIPWIQLWEDGIWLAHGTKINYYSLNHRVIKKPAKFTLDYKLHPREDFCRFVCYADLMAAGVRNGDLVVFDLKEKKFATVVQRAHDSDVHSVAIKGSLLLSGSRDATVKLWRYNKIEPELNQIAESFIGDRAWCVGFSPDSFQFAVGTAAVKTGVAPVMIWDSDRNTCVQSLSSANQRQGAGAVQVIFESDQLLLSAGYDTYVRLWDLRCSENVLSWTEKYDNAVFSLVSDRCNSIFAGSSRFGLVWAYDKRYAKAVQNFYAGSQNRPVYSLAFDHRNLFCALDALVVQLHF